MQQQKSREKGNSVFGTHKKVKNYNFEPKMMTDHRTTTNHNCVTKIHTKKKTADKLETCN